VNQDLTLADLARADEDVLDLLYDLFATKW
jgi:hypothetical protein